MSMITDMKLQKVLSDLFQGGMPLLMKSIVICNEPTIFSILWKVAKLFLSKKMLERVHMVGEKHQKVADILGGPEFVPNFLKGGTAEPNIEFRLSEQILKENLVKAFPFHSEPDHNE